MATPSQERGEWGSRMGFIFAAAGSAIGLGNIWRFPYVTGQNGGAAFVIIYLLCVFFICFPYLLGELSLGRATQRNPIDAIRAIKPGSPWILVGVLCVLTGIAILSYYGVIAGWVLGYIVKELIRNPISFGEFIASPTIVLPLFLAFMLLTILVVYGGIQKGIERWSRILMPIMLVLMFVVILRSVTLEGASKGLSFYLKPDFSKVTGRTVLEALGQAFFSLSLGMGAMLTYGSYLSKKENLVSSGLYVALFDTAIALLAGFMIFPALFSFGLQPDAGPKLVFVVLPELFDKMPLGGLVGVLFFLLLAIAALTSTISLLEVPVSYLVDSKRWVRKQAVWIAGGFALLLGIPSALSQGAVPALSSLPFFGGKGFLDLMDFIWGNISLALGAMLLSIFIGWVWGINQATDEVLTGAPGFKPYAPVWSLFIRYICPAVIFIVLLNIVQVF